MLGSFNFVIRWIEHVVSLGIWWVLAVFILSFQWCSIETLESFRKMTDSIYCKMIFEPIDYEMATEVLVYTLLAI